MNTREDRTALAEAFAKALAADFAAHGEAAIAALRANKVDVYVRLVAQIAPAEGADRHGWASALSDDEALEIIAQLDRWDKANRRSEGAETDEVT
jgi:hypothetical protein